MLAAVDDVAGKAAEAKGELAAEIKKSANDDEEAAEKEEGAAEFAERVHGEHCSGGGGRKGRRGSEGGRGSKRGKGSKGEVKAPLSALVERSWKNTNAFQLDEATRETLSSPDYRMPCAQSIVAISWNGTNRGSRDRRR